MDRNRASPQLLIVGRNSGPLRLVALSLSLFSASSGSGSASLLIRLHLLKKYWLDFTYYEQGLSLFSNFILYLPCFQLQLSRENHQYLAEYLYLIRKRPSYRERTLLITISREPPTFTVHMLHMNHDEHIHINLNFKKNNNSTIIHSNKSLIIPLYSF